GGFGAPEFETIEIPVEGDNDQHVGILNDWADAIVFGKPLWSPGVEGIKGLTLCNGMYLSGWTGEKVTLPLDEDRFNALLAEKVKNSRRKESTGGATFDLDGTYNK
ncbi:MAG: gfo/Idh/MocA family oxidoreductase, partial [Clostridia bacterium]|nr:gfo/Idh/MocA family oxidoreductase [Clostridia bacterium]